MNEYNVSYYKAVDGSCPVKEFIDSRDLKNQSKILNWIEQLEVAGPQLPRPYGDILHDGIHELRIKLSGDEVRILYFFDGKDIILTHAFIKRSEKVPSSEIDRAISLREEYLGGVEKEKDIEA